MYILHGVKIQPPLQKDRKRLKKMEGGREGGEGGEGGREVGHSQIVWGSRHKDDEERTADHGPRTLSLDG